MARGDDRERGRNDVVPAPVIVSENTYKKEGFPIMPKARASVLIA
ncbi:hypothetical protein [Burkholderia sp. D-99]|nr:hypothetical protein [Burkholderia sp. D-99]